MNVAPVGIKHVRVAGTFYDSNTQIIGSFLSLTYPSDIDAGGKALFELLALPEAYQLRRLLIILFISIMDNCNFMPRKPTHVFFSLHHFFEDLERVVV